MTVVGIQWISHQFMQRVEFTVAFLNSMLSAIHQHFNFEDLKGRKCQYICLDKGELCC